MQNSKSIRRLAADHGSLHTVGLPPNYLFPPPSLSDSSADLTSLDVLLAGPVGTPYSQGLWRLHLEIPTTYPAAPPTATFRTRLWHPNIDEETGAVCVETLKRDWSSTLKLRDVLVTISCLLIQPNPASALNEAAGKLASEDWNSYCRRAKLMTEIHATVPDSLVTEVREAQKRGEDPSETTKSRESKPDSGVKGDQGAKDTSSTAAKTRQRLAAAEDEENRKRRGDTVGLESDQESDWIPGPAKPSKTASSGKPNIFGIKGLDRMSLDATPNRIFPASPGASDQETPRTTDDKKPFITVSYKSHNDHSFDLGIPPLSFEHDAEAATDAKDTPEILKFSHQNPFSAIQTNNQNRPIIREFSWTWQDSEILHNTGTMKDGPTRADVRKRMAGDDFQRRRRWEMKKFKKAGYSLERYNRGDFGPRTGMFRL